MRNRKWFWPAVMLVAACLAPSLAPRAAAQQEPVLAGRVSYIEGQLLRFVPETQDWVAEVKDAPFGLNDALYSDASAKAEFIMPNGLWVRIDGSTQIQLITLKAEVSEVDVASGVARFYNRNGVLKVTTPFGYVVAEPGSTFDIYVGDQSVEVLALNSRVDYFQQGSDAKYEVVQGGPSILADATQVGSGEGKVDAAWDDWNASRDTFWAKKIEVRGETVKYIPPQLQDEASDLEESGTWERVNYEGGYHEFWRPTGVPETWQPFTVGRWTDYYGDQVWIPGEPFGYVTHHYGNWVNVNGRWYWAPPAPAMQVAAGPSIAFGWYPGRVAWIGGDDQVGWVPLAPAEPYYCHHYWGPSAVVVTTGPEVAISIAHLAFASAAIIVPQASFYSVTSYSSVRVTNINQTTIINNFHAAPVVNNTIIHNYSQEKAKYNFTNKAPSEIPHTSVTERIVHNERVANDSKNITPQSLKQAVATAKPAKPMQGVAVPAPTKLTNKMVQPNQVNAPKGQAPFKQVEIMKNTKPATASPAAKAGGPGAAPSPGVTQPQAPGTMHPAAPGTMRPMAPETHPGTPGVTQPQAPGTMHPTTPEIPSARPQPGTPGVTQPQAPGTMHPAAPGTMRPMAPETHPGTPGVTQPQAPGTMHPTTPEIPSARPQPGAPGVTQPQAPGTMHPAAPGTMRPMAPETHPGTPGVTQPQAPGTTHPAAPGTMRPMAPETHPGAPGVTQPQAPGTTHPAAPGTMRPTTPETHPGAPGGMHPATPETQPVRPHPAEPEVNRQPAPGASHPAAPGGMHPAAPETQPARPHPAAPEVNRQPAPGATHPAAPGGMHPAAPETQPARPHPATPEVNRQPAPGASHPAAPGGMHPAAPETQPARPHPATPEVNRQPAPGATHPAAPGATHPTATTPNQRQDKKEKPE